jgi:hypothetical protein
MTLWLIAQSVACYGGAYFTTETVKTAKPCHMLLQNVWRQTANKQTSKHRKPINQALVHTCLQVVYAPSW